MSRHLVSGGHSFLVPPFVSQMAKQSAVMSTRGFSSMPPSEPSTLGGIVAVIADKLGIGE